MLSRLSSFSSFSTFSSISSLSTFSSSVSSPLASFLPSVLRQPILQKIVPASFSTSAALQYNSRLTSPHNFPQRRTQVKCVSCCKGQDTQSRIACSVLQETFLFTQKNMACSRNPIRSSAGKRWPKMVTVSLSMTSMMARGSHWELW